MALSRYEAFGEAIRKLRKERNLTQENASIECGMDRAYLGHIERAVKIPTLKTAWRIADMLEVELSELVALAERLQKGEEGEEEDK